jgi:hypothetical protein
MAKRGFIAVILMGKTRKGQVTWNFTRISLKIEKIYMCDKVLEK